MSEKKKNVRGERGEILTNWKRALFDYILKKTHVEEN